MARKMRMKGPASEGKDSFLHIRVGQAKKEVIEAAARAAEESVSSYVLKATTMRMKKEAA